MPNTTITDLPGELHQLIVSELEATRDLANLMRSCRAFRKAVSPVLWSYANFQLDNLTRETWPTCMYVDDDLRKNLPLVSEDPTIRRYATIGVGTFPGFCRMVSSGFEPLKYVTTLLISLPFYTKHAEDEDSEMVSLNRASDYDDYLAWFAANIAELFPNVSVIEIESDTLYKEEEVVTTDYPLLPRILRAFPNSVKNLKLSLSREMELFGSLLPFDFRIIKLRYGYTQIIGQTLTTAGDADVTAKVKIGKLANSVERFEIDTEHRLVDLGELKPIFSQCDNVKMISLDVNHEFKNLEWLPDTVKDLNFCGLPASCPPKKINGIKRLAICLEEMKVFQSLRCPNLEFLHVHSLQPEEVSCQNFVDFLDFSPKVKRLKCSGTSARTIATIVESAKWKIETLAIEYDPYHNVAHHKRLAAACKGLKNLWICSHRANVVDILHAFTSTCPGLDQVYLTWEGWVWKIGDLLENDLVSVVDKSKLLGRYTFLDGHLYNQTFSLHIDRFNRWYRTTIDGVENGS